MSYVFIKSEPQLWTVGYYDPSGQWVSDSDHGNEREAASRVHWLNGGHADNAELLEALKDLLAIQDRHISGGAPVGSWKDDYVKADLARAAIAKVEGR